MFRILGKQYTSQNVIDLLCRNVHAFYKPLCACKAISVFKVQEHNLSTRLSVDSEKRETSLSRKNDANFNTGELFNSLEEEDRFGTLQSVRNNGSAEKKVKPIRKSDRVTSFESPPLQKWSQTFGTLSEEWQKEIQLEEQRYADDEKEEDKPHRRLSETDRLHPPHWYGRRIAKLGRAGKVYEAIDVLETQMLKEDRVRPTQYVFTVLIGVLGRAGYTKKAFQLFNKMKKFGLEPQAPTYTALFNACSNSPWTDDGLHRADKLCQLMLEKEYQPNIMTYHAMIKAYARCGSIQKAFSLVDEAWEAGLKIDEQCYSFLLMACASDKEAGLKHAIEMWRLMRKRKVRPNTYHYNLLLRVVRDCGLGEDSYAAQLLSSSSEEQTAPTKHGKSHAANGSRDDRHLLPENSSTDNKMRMANQKREDKFLSDAIPKQNVSSSSLPNNSEDRIRMANQMKDGKFSSNSITHQNTSLSVANGSEDSNSKVIQWTMVPEDESTTGTGLESSTTHTHTSLISVQPLLPSRPLQEGSSILDLDVPNLLNPNPVIPQGVSLKTPTGPLDRLALLGGLPGVLSHMKRDGALPDIKTFSQLLECVGPTCTAEADLLAAMSAYGVAPDSDLMSAVIRRRNLRREHYAAWDVLSLMDRAGLKPTLRTFGCLAMGCVSKSDMSHLFKCVEEASMHPTVEIFEILLKQSRLDFSYKYEILQAMKRYNIRASDRIIKTLEESVSRAKSIIVKKEKGEQIPDYYHTESFTVGYRRFMKHYIPWLRSIELEPSVHPWDVYRQPTPTPSPLETLAPSLQKQVSAVDRRRKKSAEQSAADKLLN